MSLLVLANIVAACMCIANCESFSNGERPSLTGRTQAFVLPSAGHNRCLSGPSCARAVILTLKLKHASALLRSPISFGGKTDLGYNSGEYLGII